MNSSVNQKLSTSQNDTYKQPNKKTRGPFLEIQCLDQIQDLSPEPYLIKDLIYQGSKVILHGPSKSGKTAMAIDMGMSIARGMYFSDQDTEQSRVVFIAADRGCRIENQLIAYDAMYVPIDEDVDFHLVKDRINLANRDNSLQGLKDTIENLSRDTSPALIIFDSLPACMAGADPNNSEDISRVLDTIDEFQSTYGIAALLVHDTVDDARSPSRGQSALSAAVDTSIAISTNNGYLRKMIVTKQRYGEIIEPISFGLPAIELDKDKNGDSISSCVVQTQFYNY